MMQNRVNNDIEKTIQKILNYEKIYQKNSVECYFDIGERGKYPKEWMNLFENYYASKCDLSKINSIKPLKRITVIGEDTRKIRDVLSSVESYSIIQVFSENPKLKFYENLCNMYGLFLSIFSSKKLKRKNLPSTFNEVYLSPKTAMLKRTDELVLINELEDYSFIEKFGIKNVRLYFQECV